MGRNNTPIGNMGALEHINIRRDPNMVTDAHIRGRVTHLTIRSENRMAIRVTEGHIPAEKAVITKRDFAAAIETAIFVAREAATKLQRPAIETNHCALAKQRLPLENGNAAVANTDKRPGAGNPQATPKADAHPKSRGI